LITPTDFAYQQTKNIMQGKASIQSEFLPLAKFINESFNVRTINILYDRTENGNHARFNICFETESEKQQFNSTDGSFSFDRLKQNRIAEKYRAITGSAEPVWVFFSAFEPIAKTEANESISSSKIIQLKKELNHPDLWEISRLFAYTTFFVYTDEQLKEYSKSSVRKIWADRYFELLEPHDEFGYFNRETFSILMDSKENLDKNYQGNWYYYYK